MVIAVPFTVLTSRNSLGRALKQRNLLLTPEETSPPPELAALAANLAKAEAAAETAQRVTTATVAVATPPPATMSAQPAILTPAPALELFVRVPQHAPLAMASSEAATLALTSRAA
jgi:membrane glycosyltransferase